MPVCICSFSYSYSTSTKRLVLRQMRFQDNRKKIQNHISSHSVESSSAAVKSPISLTQMTCQNPCAPRTMKKGQKRPIAIEFWSRQKTECKVTLQSRKVALLLLLLWFCTGLKIPVNWREMVLAQSWLMFWYRTVNIVCHLIAIVQKLAEVPFPPPFTTRAAKG